jgi:formamidopyrimidine-DNA glycosylase
VPELPDVEVYRRRLARATRGRSVEGVIVRDAQVLVHGRARGLDRALSGARFTRTSRRGKTLYGVTRGGPHLRLHFGMTGDLVIQDAGPGAAEPRHTRVVFRLSGGRRLFFVDQRRLGEVGIVDDVGADIAAHDLGPDALELPLKGLGRILHDSRAGLKPLLMDQSEVAGLGNIYTDEILFQARLDPRHQAAEVGEAGVRRLHRQLHRVVDRAVAAGADPRAMPRGWLIHRRTEGAECPRGNGRIRSFSVGGRRGYWCPGCQEGRA